MLSLRFSNEVQLSVPLLPAFAPVRLYVWLLPLIVSDPAPPFTLVMPLQPPVPVAVPPRPTFTAVVYAL